MSLNTTVLASGRQLMMLVISKCIETHLKILWTKNKLNAYQPASKPYVNRSSWRFNPYWRLYFTAL